MTMIADGDVAVLAGEDQQIFSNLCLGGAGAISASANIRADLHVLMQRQLAQGELSAARRTFHRLLPWIHVAFSESNPAVIKGGLALQGMMADELREPMQSCTAAMLAKLPGVLAGMAD